MANKKTKTAKKLNPKSLRLFYVTAPTKSWARKASQILLKEKLVACTNILPQMESHYWWKGKIESSRECVLILKSTKAKTKAIFKRVAEIHPYETPCILVIPLDDGAPGYTEWLLESL